MPRLAIAKLILLVCCFWLFWSGLHYNSGGSAITKPHLNPSALSLWNAVYNSMFSVRNVIFV